MPVDAIRASSPQRHTLLAASAVLLFLLAVGTVLVATQSGPGLREDSYTYVTAAESLAAGTGLGRWASDGTFRPLLHFPPLFPYVVALFKLAGLKVIPAVRWFHAVLFGLTAILTGLITKRLSGSIACSALSCGLVLASPSLIETYSWLHSEPLYLFLASLTLLALGACLSRPRNSLYPWLAGGGAALALLDRFAGISLVLAGCVLLLIEGRPAGKRGLRRALVFLGVAVLPAAVFAIGNYLAYGNALDRPGPTWHPPSLGAWAEGSAAVLGWILPQRIVATIPVPAMLLLGMAMLLVVGAGMSTLYVRLRRSPTPSASEAGSWALLLAGYFTSYLVVLLLTVLFFDRLTPLNDRILSPLYLTAVPAVAVAAKRLWILRRPGWIRGLLAVLLISGALLQGYRSFRFVATTRQAGLGLSGRQWRGSPTIAYLRTLPAHPLYSNNLPALYFLAGRDAAFVPSSWNPASDQPRVDFDSGLERMRRDLRCQGALLIIVGSNPAERLPVSDRAELFEGLTVVAKLEDGLVYGAPPDSCPG
jgi:hypothetical protein